MRRIAVLLIGLLLAGNIWAAGSQQPAPSEGQKIQAPNTQTRNNQQVASQHQLSSAPIRSTNSAITSKIDAAQTTKQSDNQSPQHWWNQSPDWWVAVFTGLIFVVATIQAGLFIWQLFIMRATLTLANRPKIVVSNFRLHRDGETIQLPTVGMGIQYRISNKGGTKATIIQNRVALLLGPIPNTLPYEEAKQIHANIPKLEAGESKSCDYDVWEGTSLFEQFEKVLRGQTAGAVLYGFVEFRDDAGGGGRIEFKRRWNPNTHAFERYKNSQKSN